MMSFNHVLLQEDLVEETKLREQYLSDFMEDYFDYDDMELPW